MDGWPCLVFTHYIQCINFIDITKKNASFNLLGFFFVDNKIERAENRMIFSKPYKLIVVESGIKSMSPGSYSDAAVIGLCYFSSP